MPTWSARLLSYSIVLLILFLSGCNFYIYLTKDNAKPQSNSEITLNFWGEIINKYPTYGEAYLEMAKESRRFGRFDLGESYERKAEVLGVRTERK